MDRSRACHGQVARQAETITRLETQMDHVMRLTKMNPSPAIFMVLAVAIAMTVLLTPIRDMFLMWFFCL
jgi:hypothetical protein